MSGPVRHFEPTDLGTLSRCRSPGGPKDEPPPRSLDDVTFQRDLDELQDPLHDETFFGRTSFAWGAVLVSIIAVLLPLILLIWFSYDAFLHLNQTFITP